MDQVKTGKFIAALRKEQGLTQEQLGERLDVTNKTVSRWETGSYMPPIDILLELSRVLDISLNELLSGERLNDEQLRVKADKNVLEAYRGTSFSLKEREKYWKKKWLREHIALIAVWVIVLLNALVWLYFSEHMLFAPLWTGLCLIVYMWLRNKMMIYVEDKLYK